MSEALLRRLCQWTFRTWVWYAPVKKGLGDCVLTQCDIMLSCEMKLKCLHATVSFKCVLCEVCFTGYTVKLFCLLSTDVCGYASAIVNLLLNSSLFTVFREYAAIYCMLENVILSFSVICPTLAPPLPRLIVKSSMKTKMITVYYNFLIFHCASLYQ